MISDLDRFWAELETQKISTATQPKHSKAAPDSPTISGHTLVPNPQEYICLHCAGSGQCNCITCGHFETHAVWKTGRCTRCVVRERERVQ
jgi:hypothetical protein